MSNAVIKLDIPNPRVAVVEKGSAVFAPFMVKLVTDMIRRLGGQRSDFVQEARNAAFANRAMLRAVTRGITLGYYHTPAEELILSVTPTSATTATISIAQHTRSTAAATLEAGSVTGVTRGETYFVYYSDAGDAGGAVTYLATTDVAGLTTAGVRLVGAIFIETPSPSAGTAA